MCRGQKILATIPPELAYGQKVCSDTVMLGQGLGLGLELGLLCGTAVARYDGARRKRFDGTYCRRSLLLQTLHRPGPTTLGRGVCARGWHGMVMLTHNTRYHTLTKKPPSHTPPPTITVLMLRILTPDPHLGSALHARGIHPSFHHTQCWSMKLN